MNKSIKLILTAVVLFYGMTSYSQKQITIDDLWTNWSFYPNSVDDIRSMNDGENYTILERNGDLNKFSYKTGEKIETILSGKSLKIGRITAYKFNNDETKILLETNKKRIYRRSYTADYYIYDIKTKKNVKLSANGEQQIANFSPNGENVTFIRNNNLFIADTHSGVETQITFDGKHNKIINGIPDWVYEEEFSFNRAYEWLPDSKNIAFIKFDESKVKMFGMTMFAGKAPELKNNKLYPDYQSFKYPKAGEANSVVSVHIYNPESRKTIKVDIGEENDIYIPRIRATADPQKLAVFRLNRLQNKFEILLADVTTGKTKVIFSEENKYYISEAEFDNIKFSDDNKHFIITSERDGYRHIYLHEINGKKIKQITKGNFDVTGFYGYDKKSKFYYYQSAEESPLNRAVYRINEKGKKKKLSKEKGTNNAEFSNNFEYYINTFSNSDTPDIYTLYNKKSEKIRVLENNEKLKKLVKEYGGVRKEFFKFKTSENIELNGWIIKPENFSENKKYPVIVTQYSGPGSQEVLDNWNFGWNNLLAQKGFIVVCVDPRGTGARGEKFRKQTYLQLGKYEIIDLIETGKYLQKQKYVNPDKIGIWGWSYGGFMSSLCMTKGADVFSAGIAVAPVTNWIYYDNIYTERFMRTPQENPDGYYKNSPINHADKLKGKFLIVHGTADDNVHWQNTAEFTEALIQADKQFSQFIYTNRNHSIYGGNTRKHLFTMMLNFWEDNLK